MGSFDLLEEPDRLLEGEIAAKFLAAVPAQQLVKRLLSSDFFSVDGTLIEASASMKSFSHTLMENRSGPIVDARLTGADGHAERIAACR